jgi:hypothetical protein
MTDVHKLPDGQQLISAKRLISWNQLIRSFPMGQEMPLITSLAGTA